MTPASFMSAVSVDALPTGKFFSFGDQGCNRLGFSIASISGAAEPDVIMLLHQGADPKEAFRYFPPHVLHSSSAIVCSEVAIYIDNTAIDIDYHDNQSYQLGWVYMAGGDLVLCAGSPPPNPPVRKRLFRLNDGVMLANYKGPLVGFKRWKLMVGVPHLSPSLLFDSAPTA